MKIKSRRRRYLARARMERAELAMLAGLAGLSGTTTGPLALTSTGGDAGLTALSQATDSLTCTGRFPNPITDICWSCILPISIGSATRNTRAGARASLNTTPPSAYSDTERGSQPKPPPYLISTF